MAQRDRPMLDTRLSEHLGDQEFRTLSTWCENKECAIGLIDWLGGGNTQAQLAAVLIDDGYSKRKGVLKNCPSRDGIPIDYRAFKRASESGPPGFAQEHLVRLDQAATEPIPNGSDGLFLLMEWRTGGRGRYDTMAALLDREILGAACKTIIRSTLLDWNDVKRKVEGPDPGLPALDFLREVLGKKCPPGGPIIVTAERLGVSSSDSYLVGSKEGLLPNPLAAATTGEWIADRSVLGFRGNAHGDLHADNILIPWPLQGNPSTVHFKQYVLIDLSTFGDKKLIAVDPAHLLLSIIARRLSDVAARRKPQLARLVLDPERQESGGIPGELARAARGIQQAGTMFASSRGLYEEWLAESMLAIAGCALLFVGRRLRDEDRRWFLELAGMAIDVFCKIQRPSDHPTGPGGGPRDGVPQGRPASTLSEPGPTTQPSPAPEPGPEQADSSQAQPEDTPLSGHDPGRGTSLSPVTDTAALPRPRPARAVNHIPLVIEEGAAACSALVNELAAEILGLADNMSADAAFEYLYTAREIAGDLSEAVRNMRTWNRENGAERHITYLTAIETVATRMSKVAEILDEIGEQGTGRNTRDDASAAVERLQDAIRELTRSSDP